MERIIYRKTLDVHKNGIQFTLQGLETADNLARIIEISLMASGDAIDFPLEQITAMMYVTTPSSAEPSINACTIKDNKVVYDVLPIAEEGIKTMQIKLIETSPEGSKIVLCSPKFAIEVAKSETDDEGAEQTTTFTALENAIARANAAYDRRIVDINVDSECIFRIYYADGTVYETDELRRLILENNTDLDLDAVIKDGLLNITAEQVAEVLGESYRKLFADLQDISTSHSEKLDTLQNKVTHLEVLPDKVAELEDLKPELAELKSKEAANSEKIENLGWITLGTGSCSGETEILFGDNNTNDEVNETLSFSVDDGVFPKLTAVRYVIKANSTCYLKVDRSNGYTSALPDARFSISNELGSMFEIDCEKWQD